MPNSPIAVAVSGGADSLFTLMRLAKAGRQVFALHGLFTPASPQAEAVRQGLEAACRALGVPLHCVDLREQFSTLVMRPFVLAYAEGRTPNPCALCNREIKFGLLLDAALALGATRLATGHYARIFPGGEPPNAEMEQDAGSSPDAGFLQDAQALPPPARDFLALDSPALLEAADQSKDQSYFLSLIPRERLARAFFPLSGARKSEVLAALAALGISPPQPVESQEVCFIPADYQSALPDMARDLGVDLPGPGPMLLADGTEVGRHRGLWRYTEGGRRGLGVAWKHPLYVTAKDPAGNTLRLGEKPTIAGCTAEELNILLAPQHWYGPLLVKTRYRQEPRPAKVELQAGVLHIHFAEPESPTAPGQIACVYMPVPQAFHLDGRPLLRVIAAGVIASTL